MLGVVSIQQNDIIKIFSIAAVVFMPPTLVASIYGMNFHKNMIELEWDFGYPFALFLMVLAAVLPLLLLQMEEVAVRQGRHAFYAFIRTGSLLREADSAAPLTGSGGRLREHERENFFSHMLAAVDVNLGAVHVRARVGAQHVNDLGDLVGRAEPLHRNLLDDLLGAGRENGGVDLARRNGVDADAEPPEVTCHFAGERSERCLRGRIGRAGERMHARAGNRGDVHHRALGRF